jgi:hypothetical protein
MRKDKKELFFWESHFNIKNHQLKNLDPKVDRLRFIDTNLDDQSLFYITSRIKIIGHLDLKNTDITDTGVYYLTSLESIKELRLQECNGISPQCIPDLNKLISLEVLNITHTAISLDDARGLTDLQNLRELYISSQENEHNIEEKIMALKLIIPGCEVTIYGHTRS